ncbi:MAG: hypothetical protein WC689_03615 [Methylocystis sp.]|jgi:hypothetical protein
MRVDDCSSVGKRTRFDNNLHNVAFGGRARTTEKKELHQTRRETMGASPRGQHARFRAILAKEDVNSKTARAGLLTPLRTAIGAAETGRDACHWMRQGRVSRLLRLYADSSSNSSKERIHGPEREN